LAFGPDGRLYVTEDVGRVVSAGPGSRAPRTVLRGLDVPLGLAWIGRTLYVSDRGRLLAVPVRFGRAGAARAVLSGLPYGLHQQNNVVVLRDRLYVGSGSTCDACQEQSRVSAAILSVRPDGSDLRVVARGLRNPFGLAVNRRTGRLYATVNGQDELGTAAHPEPAEALVRVVPGGRYGWPDCWPSHRRRALVGACAGVREPVAYLEPHSSADGLTFYHGRAFPRRYRNDAFVALWGQYRSTVAGRAIARVVLPRASNRPARVETFATGFAHPIAVIEDRHGGLLVADWHRGTVYRISADPPRHP
jgi:glucose/arabinose dehydrogenase